MQPPTFFCIIKHMEVFQAIQQRRSVRSYKIDPVPEEKINKVLIAARLAPSASNKQNFKLVVVRNEEKRKKLAGAAHNQDFVGQAPVIIAAVSLRPEEVMPCHVPTYAVDLAIVIDHMTLAAVEQGLGTCWIGAFSQEETRQILNIPGKYKVVALLSLGYPDDKAGSKVRKELNEIICYEDFK